MGMHVFGLPQKYTDLFFRLSKQHDGTEEESWHTVVRLGRKAIVLGDAAALGEAMTAAIEAMAQDVGGSAPLGVLQCYPLQIFCSDEYELRLSWYRNAGA